MNESEETEAGIYSLMDTWIVMTIEEFERQRHRQLRILKSRGMAHSTRCINLQLRTTAYESLTGEDDVMQSTLSPETVPAHENFVLRLYIAGQTPKCMRAFANLKRICEQYLTDRYQIEMIDNRSVVSPRDSTKRRRRFARYAPARSMRL